MFPSVSRGSPAKFPARRPSVPAAKKRPLLHPKPCRQPNPSCPLRSPACRFRTKSSPALRRSEPGWRPPKTPVPPLEQTPAAPELLPLSQSDQPTASLHYPPLSEKPFRFPDRESGRLPAPVRPAPPGKPPPAPSPWPRRRWRLQNPQPPPPRRSCRRSPSARSLRPCPPCRRHS